MCNEHPYLHVSLMCITDEAMIKTIIQSQYLHHHIKLQMMEQHQFHVWNFTDQISPQMKGSGAENCKVWKMKKKNFNSPHTWHQINKNRRTAKWVLLLHINVTPNTQATLNRKITENEDSGWSKKCSWPVCNWTSCVSKLLHTEVQL